MNKLKYWVGTGFCFVSEVLFLLAFAAFAFGQWFRSPDKESRR